MRWLGLLLLALLLACRSADVTTEVLVVVHGDLRAGTDITVLQVRVLDPDDGRERARHDFALGARTSERVFTLPLSYSLTPGDGDRAGSFRVVISAKKGASGGVVIERQVLAAFTPGARTLLAVRLERACLAKLCRAEADAEPGAQTCIAGTCADVPTVALEPAGAGALGGYTPGSVDAGTDGSRPRTDGGPVAACERDTQCDAKLGNVTPVGCAVARCVDSECVFTTIDADGDGHGAKSCRSDSYDIAPGDDCDDGDAMRFPTAWDGPEVAGKHSDGCDGRDNDCDDDVDEAREEGRSCTCDPATDVAVDCSLDGEQNPIEWPGGSPLGNCQYGKRTCTDGVWGKCTGAIKPKGADTCQPDDDANCDGQRNEDCFCVNGEERACGSDVGSCQAGTQTCSNAQWSDSCLGAIGPQGQDTCDPGNDNDCDNVPNEGCICVNGSTSTCAKAIGAKGVCGARMVTCTAGQWQTASCAATAVEVCLNDRADEDCDGQVNEPPECDCTTGVTTPCGRVQPQLLGACADGSMTCVAGRWGACDTVPAEKDSCILDWFGGDENCNGLSNEGCECITDSFESCSAGACTGGLRVCNAQGVWGECANATQCPAP